MSDYEHGPKWWQWALIALSVWRAVVADDWFVRLIYLVVVVAWSAGVTVWLMRRRKQ